MSIIKQNILLNENYLCGEFDYAQNLPLPKISVRDQFYKRLIWLCLFNINLYSTEDSYMFPYIEELAKKGVRTVRSFLVYVINIEFDPTHHSKIVLFSDACGGQNRNQTVFTYYYWLYN